MNQDALLRLIAETGYNVGYAAKKHLATYDIVEKIPGWIGLVSIAAGIYALIVPALEQKPVAAAFIVIGIAALFINFYLADKDKYAKAGGELTAKFHELRMLYQTVKSQPTNANLDAFVAEHNKIQSDVLVIGVAKQIFLSDWYAHYKFFWQAQTDWIDEQLHFRFFRDKVPLSLTVTVVAVGLTFACSGIPAMLTYLRTFCVNK